jgi:hypothetical protein
MAKETLGQKQERFAVQFARWILTVNDMGYRTRIGEVQRSDEQAEINAMGAAGRNALCDLIKARWPLLANKIGNNAGSGIRNSLHELRLAADVHLFYDGQYVTDGNSVHWRKVGELWEAMGSDHRWGGRFNDANHISIEHEGKK